MREGCRVALGSYIAFQMSEKALSSFYAEGYHIQASTTIVLPVSTTMLVVQDVMGRQAPAQQFFFWGGHKWRLSVFRGGHKWRFVITSGRDIFALRTQ